MKNLILLLIILASWRTNHNINKPAIQDYVQIQFTGLEQYSSRQILFIVKEKVDFETIENRLNDIAAQSSTPLSKKDKELIWGGMFKTIITDNKTFLKILQFVDENSAFFGDKEHSEYTIIVNGNKHFITMSSQKEFFVELNKYLTNKNCDQIVTKQIDSYYKKR